MSDVEGPMENEAFHEPQFKKRRLDSEWENDDCYEYIPTDRKKEIKFHDDYLEIVVGSGGQQLTNSMVKITRGFGQDERSGDDILIKDIYFQGMVELEKTARVERIAPPFGALMRILLVLDTQANGMACDLLDVLQTASIKSDRNENNIARFDIIRDEIYGVYEKEIFLEIAAQKWSSPNVIQHIGGHVECFIRVKYDGASNNLSEIMGNNLVLFAITNDLGQGKVSLQYRIRFIDC